MTSLALLLFLAMAGCPSTSPVDDDDTPPADDDDADAEPLQLPTSVSVQVLQDGVPVEGAMVLQGGVEGSIPTDENGRANLELVEIPGGEIWVIAAQEGHRSVGLRLYEHPEEMIVLELVEVAIDNPDFSYAPGGTKDRGTTEYCSHCHITFVDQFKNSAHRESARDPQVHDLFAGTAAAWDTEGLCTENGGRWLTGTIPGGGGSGLRCYIGNGFLPDASEDCGGEGQSTCDEPELDPALGPSNQGACADCHAPATGGVLGGGESLLHAEGLAYEEGVTCDFCHKVATIDPTKPPGIGGRTVLGRPLEDSNLGPVEFKPVMYGPYADVLNPFMGGAFSPIFSSGELCSGCHEYEQEPLWASAQDALDTERWPEGRLPIHSTWSEWAGSIHAPSTPCQTCHMPATGALNSADIEFLGLDPGIAAGFHRGPTSVRDHSFYGPLAERPNLGTLLEDAASLSATASVDGTELLIESTVTNLGAGHALPTGEPLRSILVVVDARCDELPLPQIEGPVLSRVAGAYAVGTFGIDALINGQDLEWSSLVELPPTANLRLTALRPTGDHLDYEGVGRFTTAEGSFAPEGKGLPERTPLGSWNVSSSAGGVLTPEEPLTLQSGDILILSEAFVAPQDKGTSLMLAGQAGIDFARVLADETGSWPTPHHRAVDILRDNRLLPFTSDTRSYRFALPTGCTEAEAAVSLIYRAYPPGLARERGWPALDHLMVERVLSVE